jgi:hypothetical protein
MWSDASVDPHHQILFFSSLPNKKVTETNELVKHLQQKKGRNPEKIKSNETEQQVLPVQGEKKNQVPAPLQ